VTVPQYAVQKLNGSNLRKRSETSCFVICFSSEVSIEVENDFLAIDIFINSLYLEKMGIKVKTFYPLPLAVKSGAMGFKWLWGTAA
jgi:hypothetical protein